MPESKSGALPLGDSPAEKPVRAPHCSRSRRESRPRASPVRALTRTTPSGCRASVRTTRLHAMRGSAAQRCARLALRWRTRRTRTLPIRSSAHRARRAAQRVRSRRRSPGTAPRDRLEIVAAITLGKDVHFRRRRVACQFRRREHRRGRHVRRGGDEHEPQRAARDRRRALRRCRARRAGSPPTKNGTSAPSVERRSRSELAPRQAESPQPVEREQHASRRPSCRRPGRRPSECACRARCRRRARAPRRALQRARRAHREVVVRRHAVRRRGRATIAPSSRSVERRSCRRDRSARTAIRACDSRRRAGRSRAGTD